MAGSGGFRFLYRTEAGRIPRAIWVRGALPLLLVLSGLTAVLRQALRFTNKPLGERAFIDGPTIAAHVYIVVYAAAALLIAISWVNLSAKRFRDRGRQAPLALAGLLPLAAFVAGAAHWLQPRVAEVMPRWSVTTLDALALVVLVWTIAEMFDFFPGRKP